jgi:hypothetical protein
MASGRRVGGLLLGTLLAMLVAWSPASVQPAFAAGSLGVQARTTYAVDPGSAAVHVAIDYVVTNNKSNTTTMLYYYRTLSLGVQPGASNLRAADGSGGLSTSSTSHPGYTAVQLRLRANLYAHRSTSFTLRYELRGGKPRSASPIRVGRAFVTFGVWAFGDRGDASVEVRVPAGFTVSLDGDSMTTTSGASGTVLRATPSDPDRFFTIVTGDDPAEFDQHKLSLPGGADIVVLSWPEDAGWERSVTGTLETGFPRLQALVGLEWPVDHALRVRERYTPALEGYAGLFKADEGIDISEDLDPVTVLHEASHAWFNGGLFADRWIYEGLAEEYAWQVLTATGGDPQPIPDQPEPTDPGARPLLGWTFPQAIRDQATSDEERYGYAASFWVLHQVVGATGLDQMRRAFQAATANITAYPGTGVPETVPAKDDWRRFLDLVEPIDEPDPAPIEAAMRDVVTTTMEAQTLASRATARDDYRQLVAAGNGWSPPWYVREAMGDWRFEVATGRMAEATAVLTLRDEALAEAGREGLHLDTAAVQRAYEQAGDDLVAATALAREELAAIEAIAGAHAAVGRAPDLIAQIGLLGENPKAGYDTARAAFEAGDPGTAIARAQATERAMTAAPARGQERLVLGGIVAAALAGFIVLLVVLRRRRAVAQLGIQPGTAAFLALDARFAAGPPPAPGTPPATEPLQASGTLGGHPDAPPSPLGEAPPDNEHEANAS